MIQTPQSFYNADIFQFNLFSESTLPNEQDFFSKEINVCNNSHGAAVYTGSNTLIFRKAIEDVGGFPTDTITEDFELGVRMNAAGYVNYSTKSPMASGLTPTDLKSVIKQRARWGRGVIRSSYNMNIFFNPKLTKGQRIVYINGYLIGGLSLDGYCISWHRFYIRFSMCVWWCQISGYCSYSGCQVTH